MLHRNAKLTPAGRRLLVDRIASGRPVAHVAAEMGVARQTAHRWWRRFVAEGESGLQDRSCRPRRSPRRTPRALERRIERLRRRQKLGPVRIGYRLGLAASTVYRVLCRLGLQRLSWLDRPTGRVIRRYEHPHPGDLLHMDIKKLGRIPPGGGWRAHGRGRAGARQRVGYAYIHSAVDDHSRLAYSEVLADERAVTVVAFWRRALAWFADRGVTAQAVLTDNGSAYRSADFARACLAAGIRHRRTRPYRPQTNGKVERFNRTLLEEWAYVRVYRSEQARTAALARWLHHYNHHRGHTALGGLPPVSRVTNSRDSTPSGDGPFPAAVVIHGSGTSSRGNGWYLSLALHLQEQGIVVLLPDKRGSEQSGGDWRTSSFEDLATDTVAAVSYLGDQSDVPVTSVGVVGMSQGGRFAPLVANGSPDVAWVVNVVGGSVTMHEALRYEEIHNLRQLGFLPGVSDVMSYGTSYLVRTVGDPDFWTAIGDFDPLPHWDSLAVPALVAYGEDDTNVRTEESTRRFRALDHPNIMVVVYSGSGHGIEDPEGQGNRIFRRDALDDIANFIHRNTT